MTRKFHLGLATLAVTTASCAMLLTSSASAQVRLYGFPGPTYPTPPIQNVPGPVYPISGYMSEDGTTPGAGQIIMDRQLGFAGVIRPSGGLLIRRLSPLSPLARLGVEQEDVISTIGGRTISSGDQFFAELNAQMSTGKEIEWSIRKFEDGGQVVSTESKETLEAAAELEAATETAVSFDVSGTWNTQSRIGNAQVQGGNATLKQDGNKVTGSFPLARGGSATFTGTIKGNVIDFDWEKDKYQFGTGRLAVLEGSLVGTYTNDFRVQTTNLILSR